MKKLTVLIALVLLALTACQSYDNEKNSSKAIDNTLVHEIANRPADITKEDEEIQKFNGGLAQGIVTGRYYDEMYADPDKFFNDWYNMGIEWIRIEFEEFWELDGSKDYDSPEVLANKKKFASIIDEAHKRNIRVLGVIGFNAMKRDPDFPNTDDSIKGYIRAVKWHLDNYDIDAIEIWNEPWYYGFGPGERLARYGKLLVDTYETLKPEYRDVLFVGPVTSNAERMEWLGYHNSKPSDNFNRERSIFNCSYMQDYRDTHNGALPLDVVSWHPYGAGGDPLSGKNAAFYHGRDFEAYYNEILDYKDIKGRPIIGDYPIWFTEYSWDSNIIGEKGQRQYYEGMLKKMKELPQIKAALIYTYRDDEIVAGTEYKNYGLKRSSLDYYKPKRLYYSFFANNSGVGLCEDGSTIDAIVSKYISAGGREGAGIPAKRTGSLTALVQELSDNGGVQYFKGGTLGECAIYKNNKFRKAYVLKSQAYNFYHSEGGPSKFGWPVSDEYTDADGYTYQDFQKGRMKWKEGKSIAFIEVENGLIPSDNELVGLLQDKGEKRLVEAITGKYDLLGEEILGVPTGEVQPWNGNALIQEFNGGKMGKCFLVSKTNSDNAFVLKHDVLEYYSNENTRKTLGWPLTDEYELNGFIYQNFEKSRIERVNGRIVLLNDIGWFLGETEKRIIQIVEAYDSVGGKDVAGVADGKVHWWDNGVLIQNLKESIYSNRIAILMKGENAPKAYILKDKFFDFYVGVGEGRGKNSGPTGYGCITSDEYKVGDTIYQDCEYGKLMLKDAKVSWHPN